MNVLLQERNKQKSHTCLRVAWKLNQDVTMQKSKRNNINEIISKSIYMIYKYNLLANIKISVYYLHNRNCIYNFRGYDRLAEIYSCKRKDELSFVCNEWMFELRWNSIIFLNYIEVGKCFISVSLFLLFSDSTSRCMFGACK